MKGKSAMKSDRYLEHPPLQEDCPKTRLAHGALAAVDACACGMLQLHLGAITLRMAPSALAELESTLREALVEHAHRFPADDALAVGLSPGRRERGAA